MDSLSIKNTIITIKSPNPGPVVAIFAAIHGNEHVGVLAINKILSQDFSIKKGVVYFVLANPFAYEKNVRQCDINMNRIFSRKTKKEFPEEIRTHELMDILDKSEALLDIHAFNSPEGNSFIIGSQKSKKNGSYLPFDIFSYGWDVIEPGDTTCYMYDQQKEALCVECGSVNNPDFNVPKTIDTILSFLSSHDIFEYPLKNYNQKIIRVHTVGIKETNNFFFTKEFKDFEELIEGGVLAKDGNKEYICNKGEVIIFPRPNKPIGGEVFILGNYE